VNKRKKRLVVFLLVCPSQPPVFIVCQSSQAGGFFVSAGIDLTDVTLACGDKKQLKAHKVILSVKNDTNSHKLILMN
jgi:hypothetical protein